jgi:cytochrome P450
MIVVPPPPEGGSAVLLATVGAVAASLVFYLYTTRAPAAENAKLRTIPYPDDTLPLLGNALSFYRHRHDMRAWSVQQCLKFKGEPWMRKIPGQPEIVTFARPEAIEAITTTQFEDFEKGAFQIDIISALFGHGIVTSDGARWAHQRKVAARFFSARSLRTLMHQSLHKNLEQVCAVLDSAQQSGEPADLKKLFHELTLQTFVEMGLGVELNWIGRDDTHPFQTSIEAASRLLVHRFRVPGWVWRLQRWLNIGSEAKLAHHMAIVYAWLREVIAQGLATTTLVHNEETEITSKSIIELFVEHSQEDKDGLRADDLADFLLTFVIGARDTTASTLSWLFYALGKHPQVEHKLRDELRQHYPDLVGRKDVLLTTEQIKDLTYLEATLRETLRLYPAAPSTAKVVVRDTVICGDIPLRKGQFCILHAYAMARNTEVWGDDAAEFKPERWIDSANGGQLRQFPPSKFFSFHAGPRTCIGMTLAYLELRSVSANLLNRYRFAVDEANDGSSPPGITLMMNHPLLVTVTAATGQ